MKISLVVTIGLIFLAGLVLVSTLVSSSADREACEQYRFVKINDVPKTCFAYFEREFK